MPLVVPNTAELKLINHILKTPLDTDESLTLKLYKNDATPSQSSTAASFTLSTFGSYADKNLPRSGWNDATTIDNKAVAVYSSAQSWTASSGSETCYGYFVVDSTGALMWAERFATSFPVTTGQQVSFTPRFTLDTAAS
ncbi:hypothetical protein [Lacunimicrobium album]